MMTEVSELPGLRWLVWWDPWWPCDVISTLFLFESLSYSLDRHPEFWNIVFLTNIYIYIIFLTHYINTFFFPKQSAVFNLFKIFCPVQPWKQYVFQEIKCLLWIFMLPAAFNVSNFFPSFPLSHKLDVCTSWGLCAARVLFKICVSLLSPGSCYLLEAPQSWLLRTKSGVKSLDWCHLGNVLPISRFVSFGLHHVATGRLIKMTWNNSGREECILPKA